MDMIRQYVSDLINEGGIIYPSCMSILTADCQGRCAMSSELADKPIYLIEVSAANGAEIFQQMAVRQDVIMLPPSGAMTAVNAFLAARGLPVNAGSVDQQQRRLVLWILGVDQLPAEVFN